MVDAASISLKEIHVSQAALAKATMDHTKQLAQMMIDDHQKAYNDLSALAKSKNIALPTNLTSGDISDSVKIADAKPKEVDEEYCDMMVSGHKDAIDKFQKEITDGVDADTKNWASSMLPGLQKHLDESLKCQEECKKMKH
jgi:putative membrane protein